MHEHTEHRRTLRRAGIFATLVGASMLGWAAVAPLASSAFATALAPEPGQSPMPTAVTPVPENCNGIAPTSGSGRSVTDKQLNDGQGIVDPGPNSFDPDGTVHYLFKYNPTGKSASYDIRDCVVVFLPGNPHIAAMLALIDPAAHGEIVPTPGSTPAVKGYDAVLDSAQFEFPDNVNLPGEFDFSWTIPANAPPGALICNYAKDTGGSNAGGKENRKAGACFSVPLPPTTTSTTSTTSAPATTTTTTPPPTTTPGVTTTTTEAPATTSTTSVTPSTAPATTSTTTTTTFASTTTPSATEAVATTIPTQVLGESFKKSPPTPLAFTGEETARMIAIAGALMVTGGLLLVVTSRRNGIGSTIN